MQCPAVGPYQIGSFQLYHWYFRQVGTEECTQTVIVGLQIVQQLKKPVLAFIISGDGSFDTERIDIAHLVDVDGTIYPLAHGLIPGYDAGYLQSCNVEGFTGRYAGDRIPQAFLADRCIRRIRMSGENKLAMYLVR